MQFNINLASQPYEAAREYRRRMTALLVALAVLTLGLLGYIIQQAVASRDINRQTAEVKRELTSLDAEKAQAQAILNRPANRVVADQSQFLNELFARKALSWTRVFSEMEKIMPPNLHVVSMKPEYSANNQLLVHMVVATDSRDRAVELVRRMEKSPHFRQPQVVAENVLNQGEQSGPGGGNIQFDIAAVYVPMVDDSKADEDEKGVEEKAKAPKKKARLSGTNGTATQAQNQAPPRGQH
jgi:type IV pilus assembly protein PilN